MQDHLFLAQLTLYSREDPIFASFFYDDDQRVTVVVSTDDDHEGVFGHYKNLLEAITETTKFFS